jgi:hypothetical protein
MDRSQDMTGEDEKAYNISLKKNWKEYSTSETSIKMRM